ncbi:MAG: alpha/beta hydrolase [Oscillospiraceae bacterium]|nr:alpha/beta hydrolase [Oscillospiraceae bacterium]
MDYTPKETFVRLGKRIPGVLYDPAERENDVLPAILVMHSDEDYLSCPTGPEMAKRGVRVLCANVMSKEGMFFSLPEKLSAVHVAVNYLRGREDIGKIYLMGHSGGATLMTAYQAIAENGPEIFKDPSYILPYPFDEKLSPADGVILPDANWGNAVMQLFSLDPAVMDESSGMKLDPYYNLFEKENGFSENGSRFSEEFVSRFLKRQGERNNDVLEYAKIRWKRIQEGKGQYTDDEPLIIPGANQGFFNNKLYAQDIRLMSHTAKPRKLIHADGSITEEIVFSLRNPENPRSWTGSLMEGARIMTVYNYLSSYAVRTTEEYWYGEDHVKGIDWHSTYNSPVGNVEFIRVPTLILGMTAGWEYLASETIYEHSASQKKVLAFIEGATHKFTTEHSKENFPGQFGDTMKTLHDIMAEWIVTYKISNEERKGEDNEQS